MPSYKNPGPIEFEGIINDRQNIEFPYDVLELYGVRGRVPVKVWYDSEPYRGSMVRMNTPRHCVFLTKDLLARIGKDTGDSVRVRVELDTEERTIEIPAGVKAALQEAGLLEVFEKLAFTHRREYIMWITDAKRDETRAKRIAKMLEMVRAKSKI